MKNRYLLIVVLAFALTLFAGGAAASSDVFRFSSNVEIKAGDIVNGDVVAMAGNVTVNGQVNGDVVAMLGNVNLGPDAIIRGDVVAMAGNVNNDSGGTIIGSVVSISGLPLDRTKISEFRHLGRVSIGLGHRPAWDGIRMLVGILLAAAVAAMFPNAVRRTKNSIQQQTGSVVLFGALVVMLAIPAILISIVTLVGPFVLAIALYCAWLLGYTALMLLVGDLILKGQEQPVIPVVLGAVIFGALGLLRLPGLGLVFFALGVVAIGAATVSQFGTRGETA